MKFFRLIALLLILGAVFWFKNGGGSSAARLKSLPPGRHAPNVPVQTPVKAAGMIVQGDYKFRPVFHYDIEALVLGVKGYALDAESAVAPLDFALGWGPMSNPVPLQQIKITQGNRFYYFRYQNAPPIKHRDIEINSANTHLIPADDTVFKQLKRVKVGDVVRLQGHLVNVYGPNGYHWYGSTTRNDTGAGACEVLYVRSVSVKRL